MKKKLLSIMLAIVMVACMIPMGSLTAFATYNKCPHCEMGRAIITCPKCNGEYGYEGDDGWEDCDYCWGMGEVEGECPHCGGSGAVQIDLPDAPRTHSGTNITIDDIAPGDWIVKQDNQSFNANWSRTYNCGYMTTYKFDGTVTNDLTREVYNEDSITSNSLSREYYKALDHRFEDSQNYPLNDESVYCFGLNKPRTVGAQLHQQDQKYRVIVPLFEEDLEDMEKLYCVDWNTDGEHYSDSFVSVDCAYTYFYQNGEKYTIEDYNKANDTDAVAFAIFEKYMYYTGIEFDFDESKYIRFYKNSTEEANFIGDAAVSYIRQG